MGDGEAHHCFFTVLCAHFQCCVFSAYFWLFLWNSGKHERNTAPSVTPLFVFEVGHRCSFGAAVFIEIPKKNARQCTPEQLFDLVRKNVGLEHLVLYDHGVTYENYIKDLLDALQPCQYLRMLYSECFADSVAAVQEFVSKKEFLIETAFPNMNGLQTTLELNGWSGLQNSRFGTHSNGRPIQVLRKQQQSSPAPTAINFFSNISSYDCYPGFGRQSPKTPIKNFRANAGSSLRDSVRRSVPEIASEWCSHIDSS